jgi:hypothetical protein
MVHFIYPVVRQVNFFFRNVILIDDISPGVFGNGDQPRGSVSESGEIIAIILAHQPGQVPGTMHKIYVMYHGHRGDFGTQRNKAVRAEEEIRLFLLQISPDAHLEPEMPQNRMTGRRTQDNGPDIILEYHLPAEFAVEEKYEINIRVRPGDPFQGFKGEPAYTVQLSGHQEPCIYSDRFSFCLLVQNILE